ncbi:MAG: hypothetical protein JXQ66_06750 [Campylobacterales bacterium]|nr:hypothetical protein [Campylobacterales bacterium]
MFILLPVNSNDADNTQLTKIDDASFWAQMEIVDGKLQNILFDKDKDGFENFSEAVIVIDDSEYVWPFIEMSMMVLVAHVQRDIDDIVEAFIFKELHELAY